MIGTGDAVGVHKLGVGLVGGGVTVDGELPVFGANTTVLLLGGVTSGSETDGGAPVVIDLVGVAGVGGTVDFHIVIDIGVPVGSVGEGDGSICWEVGIGGGNLFVVESEVVAHPAIAIFGFDDTVSLASSAAGVATAGVGEGGSFADEGSIADVGGHSLHSGNVGEFGVSEDAADRKTNVW